jgi:acyl carrier protein
MKATIENITKIIEKAEVLGDVDKLKNNIPLTEQGIDSLDLVNIYLLLEEKFGIKIPDEDLDQLQTIDSIVEYINSKVS